MPPRPKQQYLSLQAGRGLAALMVVVFHTTSFVGGDPRYWNLHWLSVRLAGLALGVEYFFVLSGTVILLAHLNDLGQPRTIPIYFWKRFRRVYPIYWVVLTFLVLEYALRPQLGSAFQRDPWVIVSGYLLVHVHTLLVNLPVAWTLFHEVLFYFVFAAFLVGRRFGYAAMGLWCGLSVLMLIAPWNVYCGVYLFSPLHLLFASGMLVGWLLRERVVAFAPLLTVAGALLFGAAIVWAGTVPDLTYPIDLLAGAGATLLVLGSARLEEQGAFRVPRPLVFLGDASYSIYLVHYPAFMYLAPIVYRAWLRWHGPIAIPFVLLTAGATAVGCVVHIRIEKPLLKWMSRRRKAMDGPAAVPQGLAG